MLITATQPKDPPKDPPAKGPPGGGADTKTRSEHKVEVPKNWKAVLYNDDFTSMEFVTMLLMTIFRKSQIEATRIMLTVHRSGKGVAGIYSREIAEAKVTEGIQMARAAGFPLLLEAEPE